MQKTSREITGRRRIYVASSWRNIAQPAVVAALRSIGHEVYDFRERGFSWSDIHPGWKEWSVKEYTAALRHPIAVRGFGKDFAAMEWADTFVLVQPCGRSAHLELGWACGAGKTTVMIMDEIEPELMAKMVDHIVPSLADALELFEEFDDL